MIPEVDKYLEDGCMRCPLGGTAKCKVNDWREELNLLRLLVLECGLTEELKWNVPCYTINGKNVLILSAFKESAAINLFKGVLLKDDHKMLESPGENSQSARYLKFTSVQQIQSNETKIKEYIKEAAENERKGLKVEFKKTSDYEVPEELEQKFEEDPGFKVAFDALTPGRQRGYLLYFSGAKQSSTRARRIEKFTPKIFEGKGFNEY